MIVLVATLAAGLFVTTKTEALCALPAVRDLPCVSTPHGAVVGANRAEGAKLAQALTAAEARFAIRLGRQPPRYALLVGKAPDPVVAALTAAGASTLLPWAPEEEQIRAMRISFLTALMRRPEMKDGVRATGLTEADIPMGVDEFWDELGISLEPDIPASIVAAHELGHEWFEAAFPFSQDATAGDRYGTPGPDWLDEASALSVEDEAASETRRAEFRKAWKGDGPAPDPLGVFLTRTHPSMTEATGSARTELGTVTLPDGAKVTSSAGITLRDGQASDIYYPQARVFSDFLISRSGDPGVLGAIAAAITQDPNFEAWLADSAPGRKLGGSIRGLESSWHSWLEKEYGQPSIGRRPASTFR